MAQFNCSDCDHTGHFSEFRTGTTHLEFVDSDDCGLDSYEVDDVECPECGSTHCTEE